LKFEESLASTIQTTFWTKNLLLKMHKSPCLSLEIFNRAFLAAAKVSASTPAASAFGMAAAKAVASP